MTKYIFSALIALHLVSFAGKLNAQSFKDPIESKGDIPAEFYESTAEKFKQSWDEYIRISTRESRTIQAEQEYFFEQANYGIENIKKTGKVFINDDIGQYLNKILDQILKDDPELREGLTIYLQKSPVVNAFASDLGSIFVTTGLFSRLNTEAEIAFVLCHELSHYIKKHNIQGATESAKIQLKYSSYNTLDDSYIRTKIHSYTKSLEIEADSLGMELYLKSGYDFKSIQSVFDILINAEFTSSDIVFDEENVQPYFLAGEKLWLEEVEKIELKEDEDDKSSTHPNVASRRKFVERALKGKSDSLLKPFIIASPVEFKLMTNRVKYFNCNHLIMEGLFEECFYEAYLLYLEHPKDSDLLQLMGRALYGKVQENNHRLESSSYYWRKVSGEAQQVYHLFQRSSSEQINKMGVVFNFQLYQDFPNRTNQKLAQYSINEFVEKTDITLNDLIKDSLGIDIKRRRIPKSKRAEFGGKKYVYDTLTDVNAIKLFELSQDTNFQIMMTTAHQKVKNNSATAVDDNVILISEDNELSDMLSKLFNSKPQVDSLVIVNPLYLKADNRKGKVMYEESESKRTDVVNSINSVSNQLNLDVQFMHVDPTSSGLQSAKLLDQMFVLNQLVSVFMDENYKEDLDVVLDPQLEKMIEDYGTSNFMWTGVISVKGRKNFSVNSSSACCMILLPHTAPFTLFNVARNDYLYLFTVVTDIETGKIIFKQSQELNENDSRALIQLYYYNLLTKIQK